jgi:GNAT superfamily N-acetyltransferase
MINVREATLEDQKEVFELLRQLMMAAADVESAIDQPSASEAFRQIIEGKKGTVLLAEEDGNILGLVTLSYPLAIRCGGVYSCIEEFVVSEQARGKGVGGMLIEAAIKKASERGSYELQVNRPSELGYPVYLRHGWKDLGKHLNLHPVHSVYRKGP